jgi:hypothetical protein
MKKTNGINDNKKRNEYNTNIRTDYCSECQCTCIHLSNRKKKKCDHQCPLPKSDLPKSDLPKSDLPKSDLPKSILKHIDHIGDKHDLNIDSLQNQINLKHRDSINPILNQLDRVDDKHDLHTDLLQNQINLIQKGYLEVINRLTNKKNNNQSVIINQINQINDTLDSILLNGTNNHNCNKYDDCADVCGKCRIVYTDTTTQHIFIVKPKIKYIYITAVGGGGAGGVGCIKGMFYYSGGGGGAGACIMHRPIEVVEGTIITIKVGAGGSACDGTEGGDTVITIKHPNHCTQTIIVKGGKNGHPLLNFCQNGETTKPPTTTDQHTTTSATPSEENCDCSCDYDNIVSGGLGGCSSTSVLSGSNGLNGNISIPSYISTNSGCGGNSVFYKGGCGGGNMFANGGCGGCIDNLSPIEYMSCPRNTINNFVGQSGVFGSGGGGSAPRSVIDPTDSQCLSGKGGCGIVIIEW